MAAVLELSHLLDDFPVPGTVDVYQSKRRYVDAIIFKIFQINGLDILQVRSISGDDYWGCDFLSWLMANAKAFNSAKRKPVNLRTW